jgi:hypothetical protein
MASKDTFSVEELESMTSVFDHLKPVIEEAASRKSLVVRPVMAEIQAIADKNANVLQTNIIGKQMLFSEEPKNRIMAALGVDQKKLSEAFGRSEYFKQFGELKLKEQMLFAIPMIMMARQFHIDGKEQEAKFFYLSAFYKPYATVIFKYFGKYEVNEDQMRYTVENLSERYDIKKEGTVFAVLVKMAASSYANYIEPMRKSGRLTDKELHGIFASGIYSRINNAIQGIFGEYDKNKGKYLPFEESTFEGREDSEGETFERDIESDAAVKDSMVKRAVSSIIKKPIDESLLDVSAKFGFVATGAKAGSYKYSGAYTDILRNTVLEVVERKHREIPVLFESIIGAFLFENNPETGKKFTAKDLRTAIFISFSQRMFAKSPNTKNQDILRVRDMIEEFLMECSKKYVGWGNTQRGALKKALHFYMVLTIQKS